MTRREALHALVEKLTDEEVDALWWRLGAEPIGQPSAARQAINGRDYPVLARIWDNDEDAIFDELPAR